MKTQPINHNQFEASIWPVKDKLTVSCLRCNTELTDYRPTRFTFLPYGISRAHAMLVCPNCGHVEFSPATAETTTENREPGTDN